MASQSDWLSQAFEDGIAVYKADRPKEAIPLLELAVTTAERNGFPVSIEVAGAMRALSVCYRDEDQFTCALRNIDRAISLIGKMNGGDVNIVGEHARCQFEKGQVYCSMGRTTEAILALNAALEMFERAGDLLGVVAVLGELGWQYTDTGQLDRAMSAFSRVETVCSAVPGNAEGFEACLAINCSRKAALLRTQGRLGEALSCEYSSLAYVERVTGNLSANTACSLCNLGYTLSLLNRD